jgi:hypothetical protein
MGIAIFKPKYYSIITADVHGIKDSKWSFFK